MATHHTSLNDVSALKYMINWFCYKLFDVPLMTYSGKNNPSRRLLKSLKHLSNMEQTLVLVTFNELKLIEFSLRVLHVQIWSSYLAS